MQLPPVSGPLSAWVSDPITHFWAAHSAGAASWESSIQNACQLVATWRRALVGATRTMCRQGTAGRQWHWQRQPGTVLRQTVQTHCQSAGSKYDKQKYQKKATVQQGHGSLCNLPKCAAFITRQYGQYCDWLSLMTQ